MTAPPVECGLISSQAITRALGLEDFYASGSNSASDFSHCIIGRSPAIEDKARMSVELHDPFNSTLQSLQHTKASDMGIDLPSDIGPGYSASIKDGNGKTIGVKVLTWTQDGSKMLSIQIVQGAAGRDQQSDAVEFARQLKPLLFT
ncbi:hypothetical protein ACTMTF_36165 [Nonomuraea sp. ZG12]|uniref:hypothetical protein n=1 Tax=Nonomuraea sp. ZG12 TaxID=3452207 RepID=UPI003F8C5303